MADAYLNVAEQVLLQARRPLRPLEIINAAYANKLLPWHLYGSTQDKTLHARISEDVARSPTSSRFFRTGPGVFFLRTFIDDPLVPEAFKQPFFAPPRRKELRRERVLTLDRLADRPGTETSPFVTINRLTTEFRHNRYRFITPSEIEARPESVAIHSFVLVFHENAVLSYRCGKFFPDTAPLKGKRSIGIGGPVYASDRDMLFHDMFGIIASGINELGYGIGLTKELSERARYNGEVLPSIGVRLSSVGSGPPVVHVVMAYECPTDFLPSKAALSVNDLRWLQIDDPANALDGFDATSSLLFNTGRLMSIRKAMGKYADG